MASAARAHDWRYKRMMCPKCGSSQIIVNDSRSYPCYVRRRRDCLDCGYRFTTVEIFGRSKKHAKALAKNAKMIYNDFGGLK